MPRYMDTAAEANMVAKELMNLVTTIGARDDHATAGTAAVLITRLYNLGIRTAPRAVQSTVRFNAVRRAVQDLPVRVSMEKRLDERTKREYNVLITQPIGGAPTAENATSDENE